MNKFWIITLGLLLLTVLGYFCIYTHAPSIQNDINIRTHTTLAEQGLELIDANTQGRDIILRGVVANEEIKQRAEQLARDVYGVRSITNQLTITASEPAIELEPKPDENTKLEPIGKKIPITTPKLEPLPEYTCQQDFDFLLANEKIRFATNSAEIDASSYALLTDLIDITNQCSEVNIEISGHTDSRGSNDYNQHLSQERATSVMNHLIHNGVDADRLSAVGHGEAYPIADNDTPEGLAKNRRIEFNVKGF